ncbi:hypothetical protein HOD05_00120 [Candidatus Woesearchaeota archaeon]|jgi:hypothetical protein|nr:hypothetical protein [Candidatus Woesearchaeota archaeon]MBT4150818.1 hypothetical protein [Candidatus Woesearchaeota archaeon]MBT4246923.1 hypothetical protein [Candidatus Woesearchaeota archaeon]MBT4433608.1 hypothetical protein [Candidatus Woesearchaeota archaeon]MBT7331790.1 hypothetical protein [Candidatus Woesearchaeota archaeon]
MSLEKLANSLIEIGIDEDTVNEAIELTKERWSHKSHIVTDKIDLWIPFFKELFLNYPKIHPKALYGMIDGSFSVDSAIVKEDKLHEDHNGYYKMVLGSGEVIKFNQETLNDFNNLLVLQQKYEAEIPADVEIIFNNGLEYLLGRIKIPNLMKVESEDESDPFSEFYHLVLGNQNTALINKEMCFYDFNISKINQIGVHTHPESKNNFNDNRYPSFEICDLKDLPYQNEEGTKYPFALIVTSLKGKKYITAYSIDQKEDYYIAIFEL